MGPERADHRQQDDDRAEDGERGAGGDRGDEQQQRGHQRNRADQPTRLLGVDGRQAVTRKFLLVGADVGNLGAARGGKATARTSERIVRWLT